MQRLILLCAFLAAAPAAAQDRPAPPPEPRSGNSYANPSAVIAAELALAQAAQVSGQWTALAAAAAPDAVLFVPQMVWAGPWLKGRGNPAAARKWQPHEVWSSCDGSLMVSHGAWQEGPVTGYFTTLWQRQPKGGYRWLLTHGDTIKAPLPAAEMLAAHIADCPVRARRPDAPLARGKQPKPKKVQIKDLPPLDPGHRAGASADGSLKWAVTVDPSAAHNLSIEWTKDGALTPLLIEQVSAPDGKVAR